MRIAGSRDGVPVRWRTVRRREGSFRAGSTLGEVGRGFEVRGGWRRDPLRLLARLEQGPQVRDFLEQSLSGRTRQHVAEHAARNFCVLDGAPRRNVLTLRHASSKGLDARRGLTVLPNDQASELARQLLRDEPPLVFVELLAEDGQGGPKGAPRLFLVSEGGELSEPPH